MREAEMEISEHFVLLSSGAKEFAATQFLTRELDASVNGNRILIGLDPEGLRHLFVPSGEFETIDTNDYKSMTVKQRELVYNDHLVNFLDLKCTDKKLNLVFERLVADIVDRLSHPKSSVGATVAQTVEDWRDLLEQAGTPIPRETILGLVGELTLLQMVSDNDPVEAIDYWHGPSGGVHDFVSPSNHAIEVKTTSSAEGDAVQITSLDQLDPSLTTKLHLAVVHVRKDPSAPSLDERIESLLALGTPRKKLLDLAAKAGYVFESGSAEGEDRYAVRSTRLWEVQNEFPGLRRSALTSGADKGVSRVRYLLSLSACGDPLSENETDQVLDGW
ncbi:PD-(D/E)XK motif protein [Dietzia sp. B44]|uniref:PD-(D/E)XK motif protein n=1 Tax=Dietzia sp. B44 TaxID=1630633 RepID=UPI0019D613F7